MRTLPKAPFGNIGPVDLGLEPVHSMIQEFSPVSYYSTYRIDNVSRLVISGDAEKIAEYVQRCRKIHPTMRTFDRTDPIQLLPFLKDIRIKFKAQQLIEGVDVRFQVPCAFLRARDGAPVYKLDNAKYPSWTAPR